MSATAKRHKFALPFWAAAKHLASGKSLIGAPPKQGLHEEIQPTRYHQRRKDFPEHPVPMVKLMVAARRRSDFTPEQYRDYWRNNHGPLIVRLASSLRIQRYAQNHAVGSQAAQMFATERDLGLSFDGIAEGWWTSEAE